MANEVDQIAGGSVSSGAETKTTENTNGKLDLVASIPPGALIGTTWSKEPELELRESHIAAVRALLKKLMQRDMPARREEILKVWEAELFWRGYQHLLPSRVGFGWEFAGPGSGYGRGEASSQSTFETNFYLCYGRSVVSALTRKIPTVRFVPICPQSDVDITAANQANKMTGIICRNNKLMGLMAEMARFLYTDGRASFYTRYVKDGQRFGFKDEEEQDEEGIVPENEEKVASGEEIPKKESESANTSSESAWPEPCGREVISVHGALEVKYPIKANCQAEAGWLLWSVEHDLPIAKGMYPKKADKIVVSRGGPAGDDIDRLARVNTKLGVEDNFVTSDSEAYDVTIQNAWLRDCSLLEIRDDETRNDLLEMSRGKGLRFTFCGNEFIEAKRESLDDHWTLIHADAGDGIHRPALGSAYIPIQKVVNNLLELANDYFIHGIPVKWMDNETFDVEHIKDQTNVPGGIRPFVYTPGVPAEELVFNEPVIQFPVGLSEMIQDLGKGQTAQIMTGIFPALSGDDTGNNDTGIGMRMQRDAALGRLGIPWRNIKEGISNVMLQAVQCLANNHDQDIIVSGLKEGSDAIMVELQDLKGKYYCEPDTDENFPESFTDIQNHIIGMIDASANNPELADIVNSPENYEILGRAIGVTNLHIPKKVSYEKQLGEIEAMKKYGPLPNPDPAYAQAKKQVALLTQQIAVISVAAQAGDVNAQAQLQAIQPQLQAAQQQLQQIPPEVPSVKVKEKIDDHATEATTCLNFLRGPIGRAMENGSPEEQAAYANIELHYELHAQFAQKVAAASKQIPEKGVTKTVNLGDLVKAGVAPDVALKMIESI